MSQVFNFGAGPAMLPREVMEKAQKDFLNYNNMGAGLIEISHRSSEFEQVLSDCDSLLKELATIPDNYKILYMHGGAQMQFSAVPLNLLNLSQANAIDSIAWRSYPRSVDRPTFELAKSESLLTRNLLLPPPPQIIISLDL